MSNIGTKETSMIAGAWKPTDGDDEAEGRGEAVAGGGRGDADHELEMNPIAFVFRPFSPGADPAGAESAGTAALSIAAPLLAVVPGRRASRR